MKRIYNIALSLIFAVMYSTSLSAQNYKSKQIILPVEPYNGDTIPVVHLPNVYIYKPPQFNSRRQERFYWRTVRDVKKTLPIAKEIKNIIIQTSLTLDTIPTERERKKYINYMEKHLKETYTPRMKKLTFSQGKLLIKLIDRESNSSSYELVKAFLGPFKAGFYQAFAAIFGASLKKEYHPEDEDALIEQIVLQVESGQL